jgi:pimeloyl-ACP methyl ester carboxylesterase
MRSADDVEEIWFSGSEGNLIAADRRGEGDGPVAVLLHGGGQTRHSWGGTAARLADAGWRAVTVDMRGHGDSDRSGPGNYAFPDFAADTRELLRQTGERFGCKPVAIGASLGGLSAMSVAGEDADPPMAALVLVDVTPRVNSDGVAGILGFMGERAQSGFGSLEEAADAVAEYLPHRPRPRSLDGLRKNLRLASDGRYRWHWDPRFINGPRPISTGRDADRDYFVRIARNITVPTLLVRGRMSELVGEEHVRQFLEMVPHAKYAVVSGAGHMVAGDRNDVFADAVVAFLSELEVV